MLVLNTYGYMLGEKCNPTDVSFHDFIFVIKYKAHKIPSNYIILCRIFGGTPLEQYTS